MEVAAGAEVSVVEALEEEAAEALEAAVALEVVVVTMKGLQKKSSRLPHTCMLAKEKQSRS